MERLTTPDKKIEGGWQRAVIDPTEVKKHAMTIYWALKKYEDTGYTPEQIRNMQSTQIDQRHHEIAKHYSKQTEYIKLIEELEELTEEVYRATNPLGIPDLVYYTDNTWSEMADVINVCIHVAIQQGKLGTLMEQIDYKLSRQMERIAAEQTKQVTKDFLMARFTKVN